MGANKSINKSDYVCSMCHKIQAKPIIIPCNCRSVCKEHIENFLSSNENNFSFDCQICKINFEIPEEGFRENLLLKAKLEKFSYLSESEKRTKNILEKKLEELSIHNQKLDGFPLVQNDHFSDIINQIDIQREKVIELIYKIKNITDKEVESILKKIHTCSEGMIEQVELTEKQFKKYFDEAKLNFQLEIDVEKEKLRLDSFFRDPNLNSNSVEQTKVDFEKILLDCEQKCENFRLLNRNLKSNSFKPNSNMNMSKSSNFDLGLLYLQKNFKPIEKIIACDLERIKICDLTASLSIIKSFKGHSDDVNFIITYQSDKLISGSDDTTIKIWSLTNGKCLKTLWGVVGHVKSVKCLSLLDDFQLVSGSADRSIKIWNLLSFSLTATLYGHTWDVLCLERLSNEFFASGSGDNTIKIWNLITKKCTKTIQAHKSAVSCLRLLPNKILASGSFDKTIKIWNWENEECLSILIGHSFTVRGLELSDAHYLISRSDNQIRINDINDGKCLKVIYDDENINCIKINSNRQMFVATIGSIKIYDLDTFECIQKSSHYNNINNFLIFPGFLENF